MRKTITPQLSATDNKRFLVLKAGFTALLFMVINLASAQNYVRSTFVGAYTPITVGGGASISTSVGDDASQIGIVLPFTFNFYGVPQTTINIVTNGVSNFGVIA